MKKRTISVFIGLSLILIATGSIAADGDLIVNHRIGIGTGSNPASELDVNGQIRVSAGTNYGLEVYSGANLYGKLGGTPSGLSFWSADNSLAARFYNGNLYFNGNAYFKNDADNATRFTVLDGGYVGIGTSAPSNTLDARLPSTGSTYGYGVGIHRLGGTAGIDLINLSSNTDGTFLPGIAGTNNHTSAGLGGLNITGTPYSDTASYPTIMMYTSSANAPILDLKRGGLLGSTVLRVDNAGKVGIGTTSPPSKLAVPGLYDGSGDNFYWLAYDNTTGKIWRVGSSAAKYKGNIEPYSDNFMDILKLEPKSFTWNTDSRLDFGYIADEVHEVGLTNLIMYDEEGKPDGIKFARLPVYIIEVLKQQQANLTSLQESLRVQQDEIARLKADVEALKMR
jgi:hypothetical protein